MHSATSLNATCAALLQVDETNFKASMGRNALDAMEVIIQRSKFMAGHVAEDRQANGGLAALTQDVLQVSNAERGCNPNEAEPPLVQFISSTNQNGRIHEFHLGQHSIFTAYAPEQCSSQCVRQPLD